MIRWPGRIPVGRVSEEIVHGVDLFPTIARLTRASVPADRPIDGVDQSTLFLGTSETSAREGIPIWCADRLQAVKWRQYKVHFYQQDTMVSPAVKLPLPFLFNLYTNPREDEDKPALDTWVIGSVLKIVAAFEESVKKHPLIRWARQTRIDRPEAHDDARWGRSAKWKVRQRRCVTLPIWLTLPFENMAVAGHRESRPCHDDSPGRRTCGVIVWRGLASWKLTEESGARPAD